MGVRAGLAAPSESSLAVLETELAGQARAGRWSEVLRVAGQILARDGEHRMALNEMARALAARGRWRERLLVGRLWLDILIRREEPIALLALDACLKLEPASVDLREIGLALCLERQEIARAVAFARELAGMAVESGRAEQALQLLRKALDVLPDEPELVLALAEVHLVEGRVPVASACLARGAARLRELGQYARAIEVYERKLLLAPDSLVARLRLGELHALSGEHGRAAHEFRRVLQVDLDHLEALLGLAEVCYDAGWLDQAVLAYRRFLELRPGERLASHRLAHAYTLLGQFEEAIPHWLSAARAYHAEGQFETGLECLDYVLGRDPSCEPARRLLGLLSVASEPPRPRQKLRRWAELRCSPRVGGSLDCDFGDGMRLRQLRLSLPEPRSSQVMRPTPGEALAG